MCERPQSQRAGWMEDGRPRHCCSVLMRRWMPHSSILYIRGWGAAASQRDHLIRGNIHMKQTRQCAALCLQINARSVILFVRRLLCLLNALLYYRRCLLGIDRSMRLPHKLGLMPNPSLPVLPRQTDGPDGLMGGREGTEGARRASRPTKRPTGGIGARNSTPFTDCWLRAHAAPRPQSGSYHLLTKKTLITSFQKVLPGLPGC